MINASLLILSSAAGFQAIRALARRRRWQRAEAAHALMHLAQGKDREEPAGLRSLPLRV